MRAKSFLIPCSRVTLGFLLLVAGAQKVGQPELFAKSIANYQVLPSQLESLAALFVPELEIVVGLCLLVGCFCRSAAFLAGALSLGFAVFVSSAILRGLNVDCACFSGSSEVNWGHVGLDLIMVAMAGILLRLGAGPLSLDARFKLDTDENLRIQRGWKVVGAFFFFLNLAYLGSQGLPRLAPAVSVMTQGKAEVVFDPPFVEMGMVKQEAKTEWIATYKNIGTAAARITGVKSSCDCTVPQAAKETLLPGESAQLKIAYSAGPNRGKISQSVRLYVADKEEPVSFHLTGEIDPIVSVLPGVLELKPGLSKIVKVVGRREGYQPVIKGFSSPMTVLQFKVLPSEDQSALFEIRATGNLPEPTGAASAWPVQIDLRSGPPCILYVKAKGAQ